MITVMIMTITSDTFEKYIEKLDVKIAIGVIQKTAPLGTSR